MSLSPMPASTPSKAFSYVVGIDIGGTKIAAALVDRNSGEVLAFQSIATEAERGPEDGLRRIAALVEQIVEEAGVSVSDTGGIGIGATGPLDSLEGTINNPYTLPTWENVPIVGYLTEHFDVPTILLNDADVAALGEFWLGAGRGARNMLYITISTGIGGGIIVNGHLYLGVGLMAGEVGHQVLDVNGPECYCGARGCWEMLAAGPAIAKAAAAEASEGSLLLSLANGDREQLTAKHVAQAATSGDAVALRVMQRTGFYLGTGIANLMNIFAPDVIVLGGGVMQSWDLLAPTMLGTINGRGGMVPFEPTRIVRAALGKDAGVVGAARAILDHLGGAGVRLDAL